MLDTKPGEFAARQFELYNFFLTDRLPARQDGIARAYLWCASIAISLGVILLEKSPVWPRGLHWQAVCVLALACALVTIWKSLSVLCGAPDQDAKAPGFGHYGSRLEEYRAHPEVISDNILEVYGQNIVNQARVRTSQAHTLRVAAKWIKASFVLLAIAGVLFMAR